jgi:hypothetical protein
VRLATGEIDLVALGCWPNPHANAGKEAGIKFSSRLEPRTLELGSQEIREEQPAGFLKKKQRSEEEREEKGWPPTKVLDSSSCRK